MAEPIRVHYIGSMASDAAALAYVQARFWDVSSTGLSNPWQGTFYLNTVSDRYRIWTGTRWENFNPSPITGVYFVTKTGNDATADGSVTLPYLTIAAALAVAGAGETILVGPGVYAETLALVTSINIGEMARGSVTIQDAVVGGAVVTITPGAAGFIGRISPSIINTSNVNQADLAVHVNNVAALAAADVWLDGVIISGGANGTALEVDGGVAFRTHVKVWNVEFMTGAIDLDLSNANDLVWFNCVNFVGGNAVWFNVAGVLGGEVRMSNSLLAAAAANEVLNFGEAAACAVNLHIGSSVIAGQLRLDNNAGAGIVVVTAGTQIGSINGVQADNIIQKWLGEDEFTITMYHVDVNAIAPHVMYNPAGGRIFCPHTVRTFNRGAITGALLDWQIDGSGAASVVAASGGAAHAQGILNSVVLQDTVLGGGTTLDFNVTTASGVANFLDVAVTGKLI